MNDILFVDARVIGKPHLIYVVRYLGIPVDK